MCRYLGIADELLLDVLQKAAVLAILADAFGRGALLLLGCEEDELQYKANVYGSSNPR